jgi:nucleotide-binding universal stress UspA family protein
MPKASIFVGTDLSIPARAVAQRAQQLARLMDRRLVLGHVSQDSQGTHAGAVIPPGWGARIGATPRPATTGALRSAAASRSSGALQRWTRQVGVKPDATRVLVGATHTALLAAARAANARLIVTGVHRGGTRVKTNLLGTTSDRLLRKSVVPVLLVRRGAQRPYRSVLVALDLGNTSLHLIHSARELAPEAKLHLVHVVEHPPKRKLERTHAREAAREGLTSLARSARLPDSEVELTVLEGDPRERILQAASRQRADLIAVGTHARKGLERLLLGSTAEHVLRAADADVLAVPPAR